MKRLVDSDFQGNDLYNIGTVTATGTVETGQLFRINAQSGNPEYQLQEAGTTRAKVYYDITNNRMVFQNNENNNADALYFTDHLTTTGDIHIGGNVDATNAIFTAVKITGGTPGAGKVLTSDADGDATWETPSGISASSTDTLTNKRIQPRVYSTASTATLTPDVSAYDTFILTAQAAGLTIAAPTGTPVQGERILIRIKDNGTSRALTWNAIFRNIGVTVPTATVINKTLYVGAIYNSTDTKWDIIAVTMEV